MNQSTDMGLIDDASTCGARKGMLSTHPLQGNNILCTTAVKVKKSYQNNKAVFNRKIFYPVSDFKFKF